jgi:alkylation response protein AidB-like acyl-CoA dehydrogenase
MAASRLLHHERRAVGQGSEFASGRGRERSEDFFGKVFAVAAAADDPAMHDKIGRVLARRMVRDCLIDHVTAAMRSGALPPAAGPILRLFHSNITFPEVDAALDIAGPVGVVDLDEPDDLVAIGERYLSRQSVALGGGSDEIARNVISERVLRFPRECAADRGVPFNQVKHNKSR